MSALSNIAALLALAKRPAADPARLTAAALDALAHTFGADVARLVGLLSSPAMDERTPRLFGFVPSDIVQPAIKAELYRAHVLTLIRFEPRAALVKLADVTTNALALDAVPPGPKREELRRKYRPALVAVEEELRVLPAGHPLEAWSEELRGRISHALAGPYALSAD